MGRMCCRRYGRRSCIEDWVVIVQRKIMESYRDQCTRCGECCLRSSPTLQMQDLDLVKRGIIKKRDLYTIRKGELVNDNINEGLTITPRELIKIREQAKGEKGGCIYYDEVEKACTIYEQRPVQCVAMKCWDEKDFLRVYESPKPRRVDIVRDKILLRLIEEHEMKCSYSIIETYVRQIDFTGEKVLEKILELLRFDYHLRPFMSEKLGLDPGETDLFFGRPLIHTIRMFGLKVTREPEGSFLLTTNGIDY